MIKINTNRKGSKTKNLDVKYVLKREENLNRNVNLILTFYYISTLVFYFILSYHVYIQF